MIRIMILAVGLAAPALAQSAEFIELPAGFEPQNQSDDGAVVTGFLTSNIYPATWTQSGGLVQLHGPHGELPRGKVWAANEDGTVLAGTALSAGGSQYPFRWTAATGIVEITPRAGFGAPNAYGISDDGSVVAGQGVVTRGNAGFVWDAVHGRRDLPPPPGLSGGLASAVSGDGRFIAGSTLQAGQSRFLRWDARTLAVESLTLRDENDQPLIGDVRDTNYDGSIVVGQGGGPQGGMRPVIWTESGLAFIGPTNGVALHVNRDGLVVVGSTSFTGGTAWIWTDGVGAMDLKAYLETYHGLTLPAGTVLSRVTGLSADGRTLSGLGTPAHWMVRLTAARPADFNRDEFVDFVDLADFLRCFEGHHLLPPSSADLNHDGITDFFDIIEFLDDFER